MLGEGIQVGAYRVIRQIGEGGMGAVWLAEHTMLGRRAAIKVLHGAYTQQPEIVSRFFNEARAATAIADPGIVQIFDFGQHTDGSAYIVMELLDGEPLDKRLERFGALDVDNTVRIMRQVSSTLAAAHARGIVHRDLKPENIFMVRDPEVPGGERAKILDFGIAKLVDNQGHKTSTSAVMGTPTYMSPEQCRGAGLVDQRSDVYALGCVLFRILCGRPPFDAEGVGDIIAMHLREPPLAPSQLRPGLPPALDSLVLRCLAKDPGQRFSSASELAMALGALSGSAPKLGVPTAAYAHASSATTLSSATGASTAAHPRSRRRFGLAFGAVALVAIGVSAAIVATQRSTTTRASEGTNGSQTGSASVVVTQPETLADAAAAKPAAPTPSDPNAEVTERMKPVLERFVNWSKDHDGAACPDVAALGIPGEDPWGHSFQITCTDQPGDQIIGATSAGPDGAFGTRDDIHSWTLSLAITDIVQGARWTVRAKPTARVKKDSRSGSTTTSAPATSSQPAAPAQPVAGPPPPPETDSASGSSAPSSGGSGLDRTMIAESVGKVRTLINRCGTGFAGAKVVVLVKVAPDGSVASATVTETPDSWLGDCVASRIRQAKFPATDAGGSFRWPFRF